MDDPNTISSEGLATPPTTTSKPLSWSRSLRTSCDACKQMKIKCQRNENGSCTRCIARKLSCTTTPVERKRRNVTSVKDAYFHEMEERIKRMESAIISSGRQGSAESAEGEEEEKSSSDKLESQAGLVDHLSNLVIDPKGSPNFIGSASGFSLLSPQGIAWISKKVGDKNELTQLMPKLSRDEYGVWGRAAADLWHPKPRSQHTPFPSKELALQYVNCFFSTFNNALPVVNQKVFNSYFERQYSTNPPASTAWYALFNAVLFLGSIRSEGDREKHVRASRLTDYTSIADETGAEYFRNASCCFHDLFFNEANLMAMQAMTLMLFITTSSPNPQPAYVLTSAVGNLANTLGLHRRADGLGLAPEEVEQRRNVFWVFYLMEKAISQNVGRPSVINDDDIAVDLPPKKSELTLSPSRAKFYDIFQDQIRLAIIGSRICSELYSASSQTKSEVDRMRVRGKLDNELQRWRDAIPIDIRPEHPIKCSDEQYVRVVMMHFVYLDAVIRLHRVPDHCRSFKGGEATDLKSQDQRPRLNPRVYASQLLCLAAARRTIQLLDTFSSNNMQNQHLMWMALYYPLSASLVLLTNILSNPQDQHAASDIQLMNLINSFITHSVQPGTSFAATPTLSFFKELHIIASRLVARVPAQSSQKMKRSPESDDPVLQYLQYDPQALQCPATASSEIDEAASRPSTVYSSQQLPQGDQDVKSSSSAKGSQPSTNGSPLEFAPFLPPDPNQFDYDPTIYDPMLLDPTFEWDMATMWMPSFATEQWDSTDLMGLPDDTGEEYG